MKLNNAWTRGLAGAMVICCAASTAWPADLASGDGAYPSRPITMLVGFPAGSGTDLVARMVGKAMSDRLGKSIIVENHAGAGGTIATEQETKSKPDGYTVLTASSSVSISPATYAKLPFDTQADLTPIAYIGALPTVLLINTKTVPARNLAQFIAYAKSKPGMLKFGSSGVGGSTHLFTELFQYMTGTKLYHIPYKGGAEDTAAMRRGEIDVLFETLILARPLMQAPNVMALAITGGSRAPGLPDLPTFSEAGLAKFDSEAYFGLFGPAKLSPAIVAKLNRVVNDALQDPDVVDVLSKAGLRLGGGTPKAFADRVHKDIAQWKQVVKVARIKPQ